MGTQRPTVARRAAAVCLAMLFAPALALGQDGDDQPFASAFSNLGRSWVTTHVPDPTAYDPAEGAVTRLLSARSLADQRRVAIAAAAPRFDRPGLRAGGRRDDGTNWVLGRPIDGFSNGFDAFGNPAVGPVDIRGQARAYVRQRIVSEILSKTAIGRGLSVFVDTGKTGPGDTRSRLLPFISPKFDAREGKAALTLTWKF